jgi:hypothetical protein
MLHRQQLGQERLASPVRFAAKASSWAEGVLPPPETAEAVVGPPLPAAVALDAAEPVE